MLNGVQEKLIIAYFQGGNAQEITSDSLLEKMLKTIKRIERDEENPPKEKGENLTQGVYKPKVNGTR